MLLKAVWRLLKRSAKLWWWEPLVSCCQLSLLSLSWCVRIERLMQLLPMRHCMIQIQHRLNLSCQCTTSYCVIPGTELKIMRICEHDVQVDADVQMAWFDRPGWGYHSSLIVQSVFSRCNGLQKMRNRNCLRLLLPMELCHMNCWPTSIQEDGRPHQCLWIGNAVWVLFLTVLSQRPLPQLCILYLWLSQRPMRSCETISRPSFLNWKSVVLMIPAMLTHSSCLFHGYRDLLVGIYVAFRTLGWISCIWWGIGHRVQPLFLRWSPIVVHWRRLCWTTPLSLRARSGCCSYREHEHFGHLCILKPIIPTRTLLSVVVTHWKPPQCIWWKLRVPLWHNGVCSACTSNSYLCLQQLTQQFQFGICYVVVPGTSPTDLIGDNFCVIHDGEIPEGKLQKKHIAISYHYVREAIL